jgi:hypothetical protein
MMPKKPGPSKGIVLSEQHRDKIRKSKVLQCLISHAVGEMDMSSSQVTAGIALLRKVMPDLAAVEATISGQIDHKHEQVRSDADDFKGRIAGLAARGDQTGVSGKPH